MTESNSSYIKDSIVFVTALASVVGIHYLVNPNDIAMKWINPNPLLILSVLFSAYRGYKFSFFCGIISALTFFGLFVLQVDFKEVEDIYSFENLIMPILTVVISLTVGDFQQRTRNRVQVWKSKVEDRNDYQEKLIEKQEILEKEIHHLKKKIVTKLDTIKSLHDSAVKLNSLNVEQLINNFLLVVEERVEVKKGYFYLYNSDLSEFEFTAPAKASREEISLYDIKSDLTVAQAIKTRKMVTIREMISLDNIKEREWQALIAYPIYYDGELYGVYVVLEMPFLEFVPQNINVIKELGSWFEESLKLAIEYEASEVNSEADIRYKAYKYKYFKKRLGEELNLANKYNIPLFVLKITLANYSQASGYKQKMLKKFVIEFLRQKLRSIDSVCLSQNESEILVILLNNRAEVVEKTKAFNAELNRFNLIVDEKNNKLDLHFHLSEIKNLTNDGELQNYERVA